MKDFVKKTVKIAHKIQSENLNSKEDFDDNEGAIEIHSENNIYYALLDINEDLANGYLQVASDLKQTNRLSWAGTAHEIREVLATLIRELAPNENVCNEPWFKQDPNTSGPTQKQRVKYIVQKNKVGSKERKVIEQVDMLDERVANIVRLTYTRASDAAHRYKSKQEVSRILKYFEAFAFDLLNL